MWGVYERKDSVHIIPCDESGVMFEGHECELLCVCRPEIIEIGEDGRWIINHNMIQ